CWGRAAPACRRRHERWHRDFAVPRLEAVGCGAGAWRRRLSRPGGGDVRDRGRLPAGHPAAGRTVRRRGRPRTRRAPGTRPNAAGRARGGCRDRRPRLQRRRAHVLMAAVSVEPGSTLALRLGVVALFLMMAACLLAAFSQRSVTSYAILAIPIAVQ